MKVEQIQEMFPTKSQQRIVQRIIETLKNCPDLNVLQISDLMSPHKSPSARLADCQGLCQILTNLQAMQVIARRYNLGGTLAQDRFSLNDASDEALSLLYSLHKAKKGNPPVDNGQPRYIAFLCKHCGAVIGTCSSLKSATCKECNHKNNIDAAHEVLLRTNDSLALQSTIQQANIQRLSNKKLRQINPDLRQT